MSTHSLALEIPQQVQTLIDCYYPEGSPARGILLHHSMDVAELALEICQRHSALRADEGFVLEAALLHDIGIYLTDAPGIECHGSEPYIRHGYLGAELLRRHGMPRHALVAERHTGSGLTMAEVRSQGIDLPEGVYLPQSIEERIICYADKFFSKTKLGQRKALERVRSGMSKYGEEALARFDELHALLG